MGVLVGVDVGDVDAGALEALNLGLGFACEIGFVDGVAEGGLGEIEELGRKVLPSAPSRVGMSQGCETGMPSTKTRWQPTPRVGLARARATASSKAEPVAMREAEVRTPAWCSSMMARLMPGVRPKSSAWRMRRGGHGWGDCRGWARGSGKCFGACTESALQCGIREASPGARVSRKPGAIPRIIGNRADKGEPGSTQDDK